MAVRQTELEGLSARVLEIAKSQAGSDGVVVVRTTHKHGDGGYERHTRVARMWKEPSQDGRIDYRYENTTVVQGAGNQQGVDVPGERQVVEHSSHRPNGDTVLTISKVVEVAIPEDRWRLAELRHCNALGVERRVNLGPDNGWTDLANEEAIIAGVGAFLNVVEDLLARR
jgi:hypothetical protein